MSTRELSGERRRPPENSTGISQFAASLHFLNGLRPATKVPAQVELAAGTFAAPARFKPGANFVPHPLPGMKIMAVIVEASVARSAEDRNSLFNLVASALLAFLLISTLYLGRDVFIPITLAILLSFVLAPLVGFLQRVRLPRGLSVVSVVLLAFMIIFGLGSLIASQVTELAVGLPSFQQTIKEKIRGIRGITAGSGTLERASDMLQSLSKELEKPADPPLAPGPGGTFAPAGAGKPSAPIPVEVRQPSPTALESLRSLISPLVHPLATTGIIIIFVIFMLLQREDLRNRLIRLAGSHDLQRTTAALDDAAARLSRLFLMQLLINAVFGLVIAAGLWLIGVPSAILWGILAAVLRFVPYIGAVIAAAFPLVLSVAVDPGWTMFAWTLVLFLVAEPVLGHVIEPMVYGHSTGLSPVAVVASATFWTALWGPIGLVLATPLTVCLVVLGRHIQRLEFLDILLGDRPALSPSEIFYQRMLAGDPTEAAEKAEEYLKERSLFSYYDEVALKGLRLAQADAERGALDEARQLKIRDAVNELANDLAEMDDRPAASSVADSEPQAVAAIERSGASENSGDSGELPVLARENLAPNWQAEHAVLCVAGRNAIDQAAVILLSRLLVAQGLGAKVEGPETLSASNLFFLESAGVAMVCLFYLDASSAAHMRFSVRRLRRKLANARILLCCPAMDMTALTLEQLRVSTKADAIAGTLREATKLCLEAASKSQAVETPPAAKTELAASAAAHLRRA